MPSDDLYPPLRQDTVWTVLGIVIILTVAGWLIWVWWTTRSRQATVAPQPASGRSLEVLRQTYLRHIDDVAAAHAAGRLDARSAFQALSPLMRGFAFEASGFPAHTKSLAELEREHPGSLPAAVATLYPDEFAELTRGDVGTGVARARQLVAGWP